MSTSNDRQKVPSFLSSRRSWARPTQRPKIFISYRREDASAYAGRLCENLSKYFGPDNVFMDIESIKIGEDFVRAITHAVKQSNILIVLIGKQWLTVSSGLGRRIDEPTDYVVHEIITALTNDIQIIPVLVQDALMPKEIELPEALKEIARRNAFKLRDDSWKRDVANLVTRIDPQNSNSSILAILNRRSFVITAAISIILAITFFVYLMANSKKSVSNSKKLVVVMDSYAPEVVYDEKTREDKETNSHVIERILEPYGDRIRIDKELVSGSSYNYQPLIDKNPDLVILHKSSFYGQTVEDDPKGRIFRFLRDMAKTKSKFLIYTRSIPSSEEEKEAWKTSFIQEVPELKDRLELFTFNAQLPPQFYNPDVAAELAFRVKEILKFD